MLGNFGKLNGLWGGRENTRLEHLLDELLPLAAERAGGVAWEYYFSFGGGRPPWVSGLAQGTAVQSLARAATRLDREADVLPVAKRALAIFEAPTPQGVRVPAEHGNHYAIYSFAPEPAGAQRLHPVAHRPLRLRTAGRRPARCRAVHRRRAPGAPRGPGVRHRRVVAVCAREQPERVDARLPRPPPGLPRNLCKRTKTEVYCTTADRFVAYKSQPPVVEVRPRTLRGGRAGRVRFTLSKISHVTLRIRRAGRLVEERPFGAVGYGRRTLRLGRAAPRGQVHASR